MKQLLLFTSLLVLSSCGIFSPGKRLERLQKHHPYLFTAKMDTLKVIDTFRFEVPSINTNISASVDEMKKDTVFITKDSIQFKLWIINDSVLVNVEKPADTIFQIKEQQIPYVKYVLPLPRDKLRTTTILILVISVLSILLNWFLLTKKRK